MAFWFVREVTGSDLLLVTFCFFRKRVKEALINSALRLHASALSSRRPTILSTKRDGAFWLLRFRFVS